MTIRNSHRAGMMAFGLTISALCATPCAVGSDAKPTGGSIAPQSEKLTLDTALQIAFQHSPSIRIALSQVENSRGGVDQARAQFNPTFNLQSSTIFQGPIATMQTTTGPLAMQASPDTTARLAVVLPLDVSRQLAYAMDIARYRFQAQYLSMVAVCEQLISDVKTSYYDLLRSYGRQEAARAAVEDARARLAVIRAKKEEGTVPKFDVTTAEVELENLKQQLISADNQVSLAQGSLNAVLGIGVDQATQAAALDVPVTVESVDVKRSIEQAYSHRPEIKALEAALASSQTNIRLQRAGLSPSVSLTGSTDYDFDPSGFGSEQYSWSATLGVSIPIWDGGVTRSRVRQARADQETAQANLDSRRTTVATEVRAAALNLQEAALRTKTTENAVALAGDALGIATDRYEAGIAVLVEVSNAQTQLTQARVNHINARYDYAVALAQLQKATSSQPELNSLQLLADPTAAKPNRKGAHK